jgi:HlyD family secretion protein
MIVSNLSEMEALVDVDENDIVKIAMGDSARIEVDALLDKIFHGVVSDIASSAKISGAGTMEQKTEFEVKIAISDPVKELKPGMTASSDIITETRAKTLGVPIQCVTVRTVEQLKSRKIETDSTLASADTSTQPVYIPDNDGFVPVVFIVESGFAKARQVRTGIQSETHIEILEGLAEGDEIVTGSYRAISQTLQNNITVVVQNEDQQG